MDGGPLTAVDERCKHVVEPVQADVDGEQEADEDLIGEHNDSLYHVEAVASEGGGHSGPADMKQEDSMGAVDLGGRALNAQAAGDNSRAHDGWGGRACREVTPRQRPGAQPHAWCVKSDGRRGCFQLRKVEGADLWCMRWTCK